MKFINALKERKDYLRKIIDVTKKELSNAPKEKMRISRNGKSIQCYIISPDIVKQRRNGRYLKKDEQEIAFKIAQKDYNIKLLDKAEKELEKLDKVSANFFDDLGEVYNTQNEYRKMMIKPYVMPDDKYIQDWLSDEYAGLNFKNDAEIYSIKGEKMRSKSEKIIADSLYYNKIPYKYEKPLTLEGMTVYPDFTVLNVSERKEVYWEHFGIMDDEEYSKKAVKKIQLYEKSGLHQGEQIVYSFETKTSPLDTRYIENIINNCFK